MRALRVLLVPFGSEGDVNPMLWAGRALAEAGHAPRMLLTPNYGRLAEAAGIPWRPVGDVGEFEAMVKDRRFWHPFTGPAHVANAMLASLRSFYRAWEAPGPEPDLVLTTTFGFAAAFAAERAGIPHAVLHLQPAVLLSTCELPVLAHGLDPLRSAPRAIRRLVVGIARAAIDRQLLRPLNAFRAELGLAGLRGVHADAVLGRCGLMWPASFGSPQPDWPPDFEQFGFPLGRETPRPLPDEVEEFIARNGPPVAWTHGSANHDTARFARCAIHASAECGVPCLLVCPERPALPLPESARHLPHLRFEDLFPKLQAVVHHGGIGTTAKALAAALPQLIIPRAHDQPDNAERVERLGAGLRLPYPVLSPRHAADALRRLLGRAGAFRARAAAMGPGLRADPARFAAWAERVAGQPGPASCLLGGAKPAGTSV